MPFLATPITADRLHLGSCNWQRTSPSAAAATVSLVVQEFIRMLPTVMRCEKSASVPRLSSHLWNMRLSWPDTGVENRPWPVTSLQLLGHQTFCPHSLFLLVSIYNRKDTRSLELYFYIVPKRFQGIPNTGGAPAAPNPPGLP